METTKNLLAVLIVRLIRWLEGPEPKLTPGARRYDFHRGHVYGRDDYATRARNSYGDDQY